ncbi:MAG: ABC transporter ATP-binding protein [Acidimicrobiia bacterium]|nr:ABC transporter ATP-binding protein [Acidimicrobiia bacterium]
MIEIEELTKAYGRNEVLAGFSLSVAEGESVALWGPNGAGKTTVVRCLLGLVGYEGTIKLDGVDVRRKPKRTRSRIGYVAQELAFYDDLTVVELLDFSADLRRLGTDRVDAVIDEVAIGDHVDKRVAELSGGLKQRLGLAVALLPDPPVLLLDEPTSNLDAAAREKAIRLLDRLRRNGRTMLVTSHHMEEVGMLVDRVIGMEEGRITIECDPTDLAERLGIRAWLQLVLTNGSTEQAVDILTTAGFTARRNRRGVLVEVPAQGKGRAVAMVQGAGIEIEDLEVWR